MTETISLDEIAAAEAAIEELESCPHIPVQHITPNRVATVALRAALKVRNSGNE